MGRLAITRWREDVTRDAWGSYLFLRDADSGSGLVGGSPAERRRGRQLRGHLLRGPRRDLPGATARSRRRSTIVVSAEDDAEIRRVSLTNLGARTREIELTSYAEIVLAPARPRTSRIRPSQNLFVQTEFVPGVECAPGHAPAARSADEAPIWAAHVAAVEGETIGAVIQYETTVPASSAAGRSVRSPASVIDGRPLSNTVGAVLDPIFSLRCRVRIEPGATAHAIFSTVVAASRDEVLDLADKFRESGAFERAATLAWTQAQVQLHHLGIDADEAHLFQRLANRILYSDPSLRPAPAVLARNERGASAPLAARDLGRPAHRARADRRGRRPRDRAPAPARPRVLAHEASGRRPRDPERAWRDLRPGSHRCARDARCGRASRPWSGRSGTGGGGVYVLRGDQISAEDRTLLQAAARAVLLSRRGTLADQVIRLERPVPRASRHAARGTGGDERGAGPRPELEFFNGLGGFADDGRTYVDDPRPGPVHAGPVGQRRRQPVVRVPGLRIRIGVHVVREQPREPAHPVVERSGQRPGERGDLRPRRGDRGALGADGAADPLRGIHVHAPGTARATAASSTSTTASRWTCSSSWRSMTR